MLQLLEVETNKGFYYSDQLSHNYSGRQHLIGYGYIFNDKEDLQPESTFSPSFVKLSERISSIKKKQRQPDINCRYEFVDGLEQELLPKTLEAEFYDDGEDVYWRIKDEKYRIYKSAYTLVSDRSPDLLEDVDFEIIQTTKVDQIVEEPFSKYSMSTKWGWDTRIVTLSNKDVRYGLMDVILFPDILLPLRPAAIDSKTSYGIIREHVKRHINHDHAKIVADYDFRFEVEKVINLTETESYTVDVNSLSMRKRKPKYETRYRKDRRIKILDLHNGDKSWEKYGTVEAPIFKAENLTELQNQLDQYLEDLMKRINEPLRDCPECKGVGVCLDSSVKLI